MTPQPQHVDFVWQGRLQVGWAPVGAARWRPRVRKRVCSLKRWLQRTGFMVIALPTFVVVSYWAKSAAGINLMDGPSPLHDWLYWR